MRIRFSLACRGAFLGAFAAACALSAPSAHAFTMEGPAVDGHYDVPKFDLEEQAKNFRKGDAGGTSSDKNQFSTPLGDGGKLQFGVHQGPASSFGFGGPGFGPSNSRAGREDFNRMVTPESLR